MSDGDNENGEKENEGLEPPAKRVRATWETRLGDILSSAESRPCGSEFSFRRLIAAPGALPELSLRGQPYALPLEATKVSALAESVGGVVLAPGLTAFDASGVSVTGPHWQTILDGFIRYFLADLGLQLNSGQPVLKRLLVQRVCSSSATLARPSGASAFGTLLVQLPVSGGHEGGEIDICYGSERKSFPFGGPDSTSSERVAGAAFFSDCACFLRPVTEGLRLLLQFDLLRPAGATGPLPAAASARAAVQPLAAIVREWESANGAPKLLALALKAPCPSRRGPTFAALTGEDAAVAKLLLACSALECQLVSFNKTVTRELYHHDRYDDYGCGSYGSESDEYGCYGEVEVEVGEVLETRYSTTTHRSKGDKIPSAVPMLSCDSFLDPAGPSFRDKVAGEVADRHETRDETWRIQALAFWPRTRPPEMIAGAGGRSDNVFTSALGAANEALGAWGGQLTQAARVALGAIAAASEVSPEGCFQREESVSPYYSLTFGRQRAAALHEGRTVPGLTNSAEVLGLLERAFAACRRAAGDAGATDAPVTGAAAAAEAEASADAAAAAADVRRAAVLLLQAMTTAAMRQHASFTAGATLASFLDAAYAALTAADAADLFRAAAALLSARATAFPTTAIECAQALWDPAARSGVTKLVLSAALATTATETTVIEIAEFLGSDIGREFAPACSKRLADSIKAILSNRQAGFWACADKVPQMLAVCAGATAAERADIEDAAVRLLGAAAAAPSGAQAQPLLATASKLEGPLLRTRAENAVLEALAGRVSAQLAAAQKKIAGVAPGANIAYHAAQDVQTHALPIVRAVAAFIAAAGAAGRNVLAESPAVTKAVTSAFCALLDDRTMASAVARHLSAVTPAVSFLPPADAQRVGAAAVAAIAFAAPSASATADCCLGTAKLLWTSELREAAVRAAVAAAVAQPQAWGAELHLAKDRAGRIAEALYSSEYKFGRDVCDEFLKVVQKHSKATELQAHLVKQPSLSAGARTGDPGARAMLQARVAALQQLTAAGRPAFAGWAQPNASFSARADIQAFLRGATQSETFAGFSSVKDARNFVKAYFGPRVVASGGKKKNKQQLPGWNARAEAGGSGKKAYVLVTKIAGGDFEARQQAFAAHTAELARLRLVLQQPVGAAAAGAAAGGASVGSAAGAAKAAKA